MKRITRDRPLTPEEAAKYKKIREQVDEEAPELIAKHQREMTRCGECDACKMVEMTKPLAMPNPPFSHANQATVDMWNKVLKDNPCETWEHADAQGTSPADDSAGPA